MNTVKRLDEPRASSSPILRVEDLRTYLVTKRAVIRAVDGVSIFLHRGETLGIVGESGSGKTMLARSIMRIEPKPAARIVSGKILFHGEDLVSKSEKELVKIRGKRISMILQDPQTSLNPVFRVGNQISEALEIHGHAKMRGRNSTSAVLSLLKKVGIADPRRRFYNYPHQISGGMKQRVVGAIAISCAPDIIIADEPTTSLDLTIQSQYLRLLRELQVEYGISLLFITHDFGIVAKMCDRVAVMYCGKVIESGSVRAIFNHASHPYTDALIRSVPKVDYKVDRLYSIPGQPPSPGTDLVGCPFAPRCRYSDAKCQSEYPPTLSGLSGEIGHVATCWRLEDSSWRPLPY